MDITQDHALFVAGRATAHVPPLGWAFQASEQSSYVFRSTRVGVLVSPLTSCIIFRRLF